MNINQQAIVYLENNEYEKALTYFLKAVNESRNVQSLTNLAWILSYEDDNDDEAIVILEEVVNLSPLSHFPYSLLAEIYLKRSRWDDALLLLIKSINIHPTLSTYSNLGIVYYHLGETKLASEFFLKGSTSSDYSKYGHIKCVIEMGNYIKAKEILDHISESDEEFFGEVEMAELYVELQCFDLALEWFSKGWKHYAKSADWVSQYIYTLLKQESWGLAQVVYNETLISMDEDMVNAKSEECPKQWTYNDNEEYINEMLQVREEFSAIFNRIDAGYIPSSIFNPSVYTDCYLFGCKRHNHPESES